MRAVVCDCSVTAAWCLQDEENEAAERVLVGLAGGEILVPSIWPAEMANVMWAAERRDRINPADADAALSMLGRLPIRVQEASAETSGRLLAVARERDLSAYDAAYLEVATREGIPLATLDREMQRAARAAGVQLLLS